MSIRQTARMGFVAVEVVDMLAADFAQQGSDVAQLCQVSPLVSRIKLGNATYLELPEWS